MTETPDEQQAPRLGAEIDALLEDPELWAEPSGGLDDRILEAIESEAAPFEPRGATIEPTRAPRSSWRAAFLGAAAVLVVLLGAVVVISALDGESSDDESALAVELVPTGLVNDVEGTVELSDTQSGVRIYLEAPGLPQRNDGAYYEGWVRTATDDLVSVGTFREGESVVLWGGVPLEEIIAFSVSQEGVESVDDSGASSSGKVVLKADVPAGP